MTEDQKARPEAKAGNSGIKGKPLLGEFLEVAPKNKGAKGIGKSAVPKENHTPTLNDLNISKKERILLAIPNRNHQKNHQKTQNRW